MTVTSSEPEAPARTPRTRLLGRARLPWVAAVVVLVVVALAGTGYVVRQHRLPGSAPYADADAAGRLTLCRDGRAVTSGRIQDQPFAAAVVGSTTVSAGDAPGATGTLYAYQPRQGVGADQWTGIPLSAPGPVDADASTVALGADATTLRQFLGGYPASWDGWVQLRLLLGSPASGAAPTYDSLDLTVDGGRWRAVDPGTGHCPS